MGEQVTWQLHTSLLPSSHPSGSLLSFPSRHYEHHDHLCLLLVERRCFWRDYDKWFLIFIIDLSKLDVRYCGYLAMALLIFFHVHFVKKSNISL